MYAAGNAAPQKSASLELLQRIQDGDVRAASSAEVLQEILQRYMAINRLKDGLTVYDLFRALPLTWLAVDPDDVDLARHLLGTHPRISSRDALHLAVMRRAKIRKIVTYDKGFLGIPQTTVCLPEQV